LSCGFAGLAVCHGQFARTRRDRQAADAACTHLEKAVDVLATEPLTSSLYGGFPGVAWAVELVDRQLGTAGEDRNGDIDDALTRLLRQYPEHGPYDLINGLAGLGVYVLARWPRPAAAQCLLGVVEQLARRARYDRDGAYWWTPPSWRGPRQERYQPGGVDLGVAHGMAGVIPLLARVHRLGLAQQTVRPLLDEAVRWLLAHMADTASGPTVPYFIADGVEPGPARSAWCYGDPGVAAALLLAARDVSEPAWAAAATGLAVRAALRQPDQAGVVDACICHGSAGLAHLFNRMRQITGEPALADAARFWVERTLDLCSAAASGQEATLADAPKPPWKGPGLLEGAAGVALALEAASTTVEPIWDQMMLVSTIPTPGTETR
jgi:lantibiotic modifying enzyme